MPNQKFEITNPQAIELINRLKSGAIFAPIKQKLFLYRWHIIGFFVLFSLFIAITIGKSLSKSSVVVFTPPSLDVVAPTKSASVKSVFSGIKKNIFDLQSLPDPVLPSLENKIDLEPVKN